MFKRYNSIENSYRKEFLEKIKTHGFWDREYVVQEKAHGANLSYWTHDGISFRAAKRTEPIRKDEKFYNQELVLEHIQSKLQNIWKDLDSNYAYLGQVTFFGEIIGGSYPHSEIEASKQAKKVQKGIYYSPQNHFFAFDIMINQEKYLNVEEANYYFEKEGLLHAKTLFKGDLDSCLEYSNAFESTIPKDLGLPELTPNICEGVIIRPKTNVYFNNGVRVLIKNKNEKWAENKRYHQPIRVEEEVPEKVVKLREAILTYATDNRLNNVLSKLGEVSFNDFGKILGMFNKDILEDFQKDYHEVTESLEKKELKMVTKSIGKVTAGMVRESLKR